jgi:hypothetical protein
MDQTAGKFLAEFPKADEAGKGMKSKKIRNWVVPRS